MTDRSPPSRAHARPGPQCGICGVSAQEVLGPLIDCKLQDRTACTSCCGQMGGPFADACATCAWGKQFWKDGNPPVAPLEAEDALFLYA